jgi:S1-C subfamily serine protease
MAFDPAEVIAENLLNNVETTASSWRLQDACEIIVKQIVDKNAAITPQKCRAVCRRLNAGHHYCITIFVANAWLQHRKLDLEVSKHKAQGLINLGQLDEAEKWITDTLVYISNQQTAAHKEVNELNGLLCRIQKQRYVLLQDDEFLESAISMYLVLYDDLVLRDPCWHGINAIALLNEAESKGFAHPRLSCLSGLISEVRDFALSKIKSHPDDIWTLATLPEVFLANFEHSKRASATISELSNLKDQAELWLYRLLDHPKLSPFVIGSFERQLKEIWHANAYSNNDSLASKMAAVIARHNDRIADYRTFNSTELQTLHQQSTVSGALEKNFSNAKFFTPDSVRSMLESCKSIGCVVDADGARLGTGFLIKASILNSAWGDGLVFITNSHVVSDDVAGAIPVQEASVVFDSISKSKKAGKQYKCEQLLFTSPPSPEGVVLPTLEKLDVTVLKLSSYPAVSGLNCAPNLPLANGETKAFVIGHPNGSSLQISLHDASILAIDKNKRLIHYRTPTEPGNSGSPVFNTRWEVIALHHAGSTAMPKFKEAPPPEYYEANEGVCISAVRQAITRATIS